MVQFKPSGKASFVFQKYVTMYDSACPVNEIVISLTNTSVVEVPNLKVDISGLAATTSVDGAYVFYTKATADGGSNSFFGPYELHVGCTANSNSICDTS